LGYSEFLEFYKFRNTTEKVKKYLLIGGMPYLASLPEVTENAVLAREYLRNVYESILLRDVVTRERVRNVRFLENLTSYLADNVGNLFSANSISKYLKSQRINMPVQTVISYLRALENSFFIAKLECRNVKGLKIFEIGEKYYFEDLGLRNVISREGAENEMQKLVENSVYLFLVQSGFAVSGGRDREREIDFVAEKDRRRIYVQACYRISGSAVEEREFGNLQAIDDHFPKYVVTLDDEYPAVNRKGIEHRKLKDFLTMEL
jgi:predicted AAA+ superfamily ATPase